MTFGDLPVVGVLLGTLDDSDSSASLGSAGGFDGGYTVSTQRTYPQYGAGNVVVDAQGVKCPNGTAEIRVQGFDFTPYNGWNGTYTYTLWVWYGQQSNTIQVIKLCVPPR
jgi:hypothetical protein